MPFESAYASAEPARADIEALAGPTLLEFGSRWCGWCRGAQASLAAALEARPGVRHVKVEDGSGRPLGRSFGVKLWPTRVFLDNGREVARLVRPPGRDQIDKALALITRAVGAGGAGDQRIQGA